MLLRGTRSLMLFQRFRNGVFVAIESKYGSGNLEDCSTSTEHPPFSLLVRVLAVYLKGHEAVADAER